jgi:hypothetical protein
MLAMNLQNNAAPRARAYRGLNRLLLCILIGFVLFPLAILWLQSLLPEMVSACGSMRWFNRPCPMCGLTRGFWSLLTGNAAMARGYNLLTIPLTVLLVVEILYRGLVSTPWFSQFVSARMIRIDGRIHLLLGLMYVAYSVVFVMRHW